MKPNRTIPWVVWLLAALTLALLAVTVAAAPAGARVLPDAAPRPYYHPPEPVYVTAALSEPQSVSEPWLLLAECESGSTWNANTGNGYYGGLQFSLRSWRWVGGEGYPHEATMAEQIARAEILLARQGWGAWPACSRKVGLR